MDELLAQITFSIYPPRSAGGQQVGTISNGVKGEHPSGVIAVCDLHRSQFKNKKAVRDMIEYALADAGYGKP